MRLLERDRLALPRLAHQRLSREIRAADQHAERELDPGADGRHIRCVVLRRPAGRQSIDRRSNRLERVEGAARGGGRIRHRTMRNSPAFALPRMKLSASPIGILTPVIE